MATSIRQSTPTASSRRGAGWVIILASIIGLIGFLYPFFLPALPQTDESRARAGDAPVLFSLLTVLSLLAIAIELDAGNRDHTRPAAAKTVALLGTLVAIDAALRLAPTFLGASPVFFLIIMAGVVYGPAFGFQMGALTLLVSAFLTGGIGPWLPFQMLGAGWIGLAAGWLPRPASTRRQLLIIAIFAALAGFAYGALLNLWSWPYTAPGLDQDAGLYWYPGLGVAESLQRYGRFYLITSLWYDFFRAAANVLLVIVIGGPVLRTLERYRSRLTWQPWSELAEG